MICHVPRKAKTRRRHWQAATGPKLFARPAVLQIAHAKPKIKARCQTPQPRWLPLLSEMIFT